MTFSINVSGGTHAGWRRVKQTPPAFWTCKCPATRPGYLVKCSDCKVKRDDAA